MTIKATGDAKLDERLRNLRATLRKLGGTDARPVARRNARKGVLSALRALRADVDERWPAIIERKNVQRLKTYAGRLARLTRKGWETCDVRDAALFATAGVPVRKVHGYNRGDPTVSTTTLVVPGWAAAIGPDHPTQLRAAKRSTMEKRAALAADALRTKA